MLKMVISSQENMTENWRSHHLMFTSFGLWDLQMSKCLLQLCSLFFKSVNHCEVYLSSSSRRISPQAKWTITCLSFPGTSITGSFYLLQIGRNRQPEMNHGYSDLHYLLNWIHGKTSKSLLKKRQVFSF